MFENIKIGAKYTRPELAGIWGYNNYQGFSKGVFTPKKTNLVILFVTRIKQESLTQYKDCISAGLLFWQGELQGGSDSRLVQASLKGDKIHLFYREIHHTAFEYHGEVTLVSHHPSTSGPSEFVFRISHDQSIQDDLERFKVELENIPNVTQREEVRQARLGQGLFRQRLMEYWKRKCATTDVDHPALLTASHIKPWRIANNQERVDPFNGLLLLTQYDKLFDRGLITFNPDGGIVISKAFPEDLYLKAGINPEAKITRLTDRHHQYLEFHRGTLFIKYSP